MCNKYIDLLQLNRLFVCLMQDGFLERLTSNEFICLSQTVDNFVTSTEQVSGRRCTTLRTTVQNQVPAIIIIIIFLDPR